VSGKPVIPRERANRDVDDAIAYYLKDHAGQAALGFVKALEDAYVFLSRHPGAGASHYAYELDIPGLRSWSLRQFPYLIFYMEQPDHIDVWRVLHGRRDIPALMREPEARGQTGPG
jgi:toxin ParE1/3/4